MKLTASEIESGHPEGCRCHECCRSSDRFGREIPWWYGWTMMALTGVATAILAWIIVWVAGL